VPPTTLAGWTALVDYVTTADVGEHVKRRYREIARKVLLPGIWSRRKI
jgi:hypothetical protein